MRSKSIDIYAQSYKKLTKIENFQSPAENLIRAIKVDSIAPKNKQSRALDFGSGDGRHTEYLLKMGYYVVATDVSPEAIHATKYRVQSYDNMKTVLMAPNSKINYPNSYFDLVVSWETMHWLGSKKIFLFYLKEFKRLLNKGGRLIMTMPTETH
jgi:SAM-dependent methyltransferase